MRWGIICICSVLFGLPSMVWAEEAAQGTVFFNPTAQTESSSEKSSEPEKEKAARSPLTNEEVNKRLQTVVSLSFTNANLRNVLTGIAQTYGLNIIADDTITGAVNITLKGVTLETVLNQILKLNGYSYVLEDAILSIESVREGKVTEFLGLRFVEQDIALEFLQAEASENAVIKVNEARNGILVSDIAANVEVMKKVLQEIDSPPQQVLIQAKLLDITHTDLDNLGFSLSNTSFNTALRSQTGNESGNLLQLSAGALTLGGPGSATDFLANTFDLTITRADDFGTVAIDALIRNNRVKVLASPTIATLNSVEAKIVIGEKFPIAETTQTTTGTLETTRFVDVGITLRVTPKINMDGYIQMQLHPEVSSVSDTSLTAGPRITTREADTTVIIKEGESAVIAGLIEEDETFVRERIPILGHLPIVGLLFQNRSKSFEQKELIIVVKPHLLPVIPPQVVSESEIEKVRQQLDANQIYLHAEDFELSKSLQARQYPNQVRILRAVELYEQIAKEYPSYDLAPEALWRAGKLSRKDLKNLARAEANFELLIQRYSGSGYLLPAQKELRKIRKKLARKQHKESKQKGREDVTEEFTLPGFR